jgi:hypothetical protein
MKAEEAGQTNPAFLFPERKRENPTDTTTFLRE